MACMGPNKDFANKIGEEAFEEVMKLLMDKYQVRKAENLFRIAHLSFKDDHQVAEDNLKKAIQELIWSQHCIDF